jgi:hypothetical protein
MQMRICAHAQSAYVRRYAHVCARLVRGRGRIVLRTLHTQSYGCCRERRECVCVCVWRAGEFIC